MHAQPPRAGRPSTVLVVLGCALLALTSGVALLVLTPAGRRVIADRVEHLVSSAIPGSMRIGQLESVGWARPVVRDLEFRHPDGQLVLQVKRAEIDLDLRYALAGKLGFHRARVDQGRLRVGVQPDGRTTLEAAFDAPSAPGVKSEPGSGLHYRLRSIHFSKLSASFQLSKDETIRLRRLQGFVGIARETTDGVRVTLQRVSGELERELLGNELQLERVDGLVAGKVSKVLDLQVRARIGDDPLSAELRYFDRDKTPVELALRPGAGFDSRLAALLAELASWTTSDLRVDVR